MVSLAAPEAPQVPINEAQPKIVSPASEPKPIGRTEEGLIGVIDAAPDPDQALQAIAGFDEHPNQQETNRANGVVHLRIDTSEQAAANRALLRGPNRVDQAVYADPLIDKDGKPIVEKDGKPKTAGLVNRHHASAVSVSDHEIAQAEAYRGLDAKIEAGLIDPEGLGAEMIDALGVRPDVENTPQRFEDIPQAVTRELAQFLEQEHLNRQEYDAIVREITEFTDLYGKAYGRENVAGAYELIRDNARILTYQNSIDKQVFNGSDHGTRHIIDGNTKFAKQMIVSLRQHGLNVSLRDEVLIHQVMINHDLGYTTGAALAHGGFEAQKDHPLASAKFIEINRAYYVDKFGEDGYRALHESVLNHSYPRLEYQSDSSDVVHHGLVRSITSTVDSLGVTVETKTPEFFWNRDAMRTLLKIRLASETIGLKPELMAQYKQELRVIAASEVNAGRRAGYENAIDNFFDQVTADNTLGHYTGVVRQVRVEEVAASVGNEVGNAHYPSEHGHNRLRVVVEMTPTEVYALIGNMFGDRFANQSFVKAMKDLGLDSSRLEQHSRSIRQAARLNSEGSQQLNIENSNARVIVGSAFFETLPTDQRLEILGAEKIQGVIDVFREAEMVSIRTEINEMLDALDRGEGSNVKVMDMFIRGIGDKSTQQEIDTLRHLAANLTDKSTTGDRDEKGNVITVAAQARNKLRAFLTQREREFLGI